MASQDSGTLLGVDSANAQFVIQQFGGVGIKSVHVAMYEGPPDAVPFAQLCRQ